MRLRYLATAWLMAAREMLRNRIAVILLFLIPALFYAVVALTTTGRLVQFRLASVSEDTFAEVSERSESLIFIGIAAVGLLTAFLALNLVQKGAAANRRLVLAGYRPTELIVAKLGVLVVVTVVVGSYVAALLPVFFRPERFLLVLTGFVLAGFVYGCYGLLVGAVFRRELEGILFIALLANIDAGWLQNPVFYAGAQNKGIVRNLPAYFPSQTSMVSAFTHHPVTAAVIGSLLYGSALLLVALTVYFWRMRTRR